MPRSVFAFAAKSFVAASLAAAAALAPEAASGQAAPQVPQQAPPNAGAAPPARGSLPVRPAPISSDSKPDFIYALGQWWDTARSKLGDLTKKSNEATNGAATATQDAMNRAAQATKDAAIAIIRLPRARFIEVHRRCETAPNGAPDCRTAAADVCRGKGFSNGHPVSVQSAENCPPAVWMSGREPASGECPEETVVLLAACD